MLQHSEPNVTSEEKLLEITSVVVLSYRIVLFKSFSRCFPEDGLEILKKNVRVKETFAFKNPESVIEFNV
jgi:hypothetical protein